MRKKMFIIQVTSLFKQTNYIPKCIYNKLVIFFLANLTSCFLFAKNFKIKLHTKKFYIIFDILFVQVIFMSVNKLQLCIALVPILLNVDICPDILGKLSKLKNKKHKIRFARKKPQDC